MRKAWILLCIFAWLPPAAPQTRNNQEAVSVRLETKTARRFVSGEIIVKRRAGTAARLSQAQAGPLNLEGEPRVTSGRELVYRISASVLGALSANARRDRTLAAVKALQAMPDVEYAQPNFVYRIVSTNPGDPRFQEQWHYLLNGSGPGRSPGGISLPDVWDINKGSASVTVAVLDTGILPNHPDITGSPNLVAGFDMISDSFTANDGDGRDADPADPGDAQAAGECPGDPDPRPSSWHGTHVAGTVGVGSTNNTVGVAGINWNVRVQPIRVLGKCGGTTSDIVDAIRWAAGLPVPGVPNNARKANVINMSLGGGGACDPASQSAINDAVAQNVSVVVAAGNSASDAAGETPASCNNVITVAASDARGRLVTRYSNFGATVEIMAPGGDRQRDDNSDGNPDGVLSMVSPADGSYAYYNGTSMAAPHVAGVAALLLACEPALTPAQVLARLQASALPRSAAECPRPCGAGLLNARVAACGTQPFTLTLTPPELSLRSSGSGRSATLIATLREGGAPKAGETVTFASADAGIAAVSPGSAVTNSSGEAQTTVDAQRRGETDVRASAKGANAQSHVRVPALSSWALGLLAAAAAAAYRRRLRR